MLPWILEEIPECSHLQSAPHFSSSVRALCRFMSSEQIHDPAYDTQIQTWRSMIKVCRAEKQRQVLDIADHPFERDCLVVTMCIISATLGFATHYTELPPPPPVWNKETLYQLGIRIFLEEIYARELGLRLLLEQILSKMKQLYAWFCLGKSHIWLWKRRDAVNHMTIEIKQLLV